MASTLIPWSCLIDYDSVPDSQKIQGQSNLEKSIPKPTSLNNTSHNPNPLSKQYNQTPINPKHLHKQTLIFVTSPPNDSLNRSLEEIVYPLPFQQRNMKLVWKFAITTSMEE